MGDKDHNGSKKSVNVSAKVVNINTKSQDKTVIRPKVVKVVAPPVEGSISVGDKALIKEKIAEWVSVSGLVGKPLHYGAAYSRFFKSAKSLGKAGAPNIDNYPKADLERGVKFIDQQIAILKHSKRYRENDPDKYAKDRIKAIQTRRRKNKVPDSRYREYLAAEYQVRSTNELDPDQIERLYTYTMGNGKFYLPKPKEASLQELREEALKRLIKSQGLGYEGLDKEEVFRALQISEKTLFNIGIDTFNAFWKKQKVCKARTGRRPSSKEA